MPVHFLHPGFLWVLPALAIPVIIHLFNFRKYKTIYFSNLKFLKSLQAEHKNRSKLKHLLLLLARILALASIILAFSQPYIPKSQTTARQTFEKELVSLYIDNSFSMSAGGKEGKLLEVAKNKAFQIINGYPLSTRFQVFSNSPSLTAKKLNTDQAINLIQEIKPVPGIRKLSEIVKQAGMVKTGETEKHTLFLLSDFQKYSADLHRMEPDSSMRVICIPLEAQQTNNLFIDTCWFANPFHKPEQTEELYVRIQNTSAESFQNIPVQLYLNDSVRAMSSCNIEPRSSQVVTVKYRNKQKGVYQGKVEITDFPVTYDNQLFFSYDIINQPGVLCINQNRQNLFLSKLYSDAEYFTLRNILADEVRINELHKQHLVVLNQVSDWESGLASGLSNYLHTGGTVLVIPDEKSPAALNSFLQKQLCPTLKNIDTTVTHLAKVQLNALLYKDVFEQFREDARLPDIFRYFEIKFPNNSLSEIIWEAPGRKALLSRTPVGKGNLFLLAIDLAPEWSNVVTHPVFIPTFFNIAANQKAKSPIYHILTQNTQVSLPGREFSHRNPYHIANTNLNVDMIPEQRNSFEKGLQLFLYQQIQEAANYNLVRDGKMVGSISFNYPRRESEQDFYSIAELEKLIKDLEFFNYTTIKPTVPNLVQKSKEHSIGKPLWKLFVVCCLVFLVLDAALQRFGG